MPGSNRSRQAKPEERQCGRCGHLESQHGVTGSRPCLATVGTLLDSDFCPCDQFEPKVAQAA